MADRSRAPDRPEADLATHARLLAEAQRARAAECRAIPRAVLSDRHTASARLLPSRTALLDRLPKGLDWAEVGVAAGDFAAQILARAAPRTLHLVDAWALSRYADDAARVAARFADAVTAGTVRLHRGPSTAILGRFAPGSLDVLYLDTDHSFATTRDELRLAARCLRPGGRVAGHDYCPGNVITPVVYGVVQAVAEFCVTQSWGFEYLALSESGHASYCLRRLDDLG
jgi:SAM-dependent methyltransferase